MSEQLQRALTLTERVHEAIQAGDWQRASELEQERRAELEALVAELDAEGRSRAAAMAPGTELAAALGVLEQRSLHMIGEVHHHRRRVLREAATIKSGHEAVGAYGNP